MMGRVVRYLPPTCIFVLSVLVVSPWLQAQPPATPPSEETKTPGDLRKPQEQNAKVFRELAQGLLRLAQKLERSDRPEDKERAKTIRAALKIAEETGVENQFQKLVAAMGKSTGSSKDLQEMIGQDADLSKALQEIVNILMTDDESSRIRAEIARLTEMLKEVKDIKRRQEILRALTEAQRGDLSKIAKAQADLAEQTKDLAERLGGGKKSEGDKPAEDPIAKPKGEPKPGEPTGESKDDAKDPKGESKDSDGESKEGESGAESKPDAQKGEGSPEAKPGDSKPMGEQSSSPMGDQPPAQARGQGSPSDSQGKGEPKGDPKEPKDPKKPEPGEKPEAQPKPEERPAEAAAKPMEQGKSEPKPAAEGDQSSARGTNHPPMEGNQQQAQSKGGQPSGQQPSGQPQDQQAQQQQQPGRKKVEEAYPHQKAAEEDLKKDDRANASKKETKAIEELAKAIEELEKRLKQLREEEMLRTLAALEARCNRMLALQVEVYENTKAIHAVVVKNNDQKTTAEIQRSQQQASREQEIIVEADRALKLMESEGSAVAFAQVLDEVRGDMQTVQRRLEAAYVDTDTQLIEENIIAMLKDMVQALKQAQEDIKDQQNQQQQQQQGNNNQNQPLIDLLAELRLIRAMQVQVNGRTVMYAKKYDGEQTVDPIIEAELKQLALRQARLQDMIHKIVTKANQ